MTNDSSSPKLETKQISIIFTQQKPLFLEETSHVYFTSGNGIHVYSSVSGFFLQTLHGHKHKVIGIKRNPFCEGSIISCDEDALVISWAHENGKNKLFQLAKPGGQLGVSFFEVDENQSFLLVFKINQAFGNLYHYTSTNTAACAPIIKNVQLGDNKISKSRDTHLLVAIRAKDILIRHYPYVHDTDTDDKGNPHSICHKQKDIAVTCVECHPKEDMFAIGNEIGAIFLHYNASEETPIKKKLHWHSLPVVDLSFSPSGSELYSGGEECALVHWNLTKDIKTVIPRLGMPINFLVAGNQLVICLHVDNDVSLMDVVMRSVKGKLKTQLIHYNPATDKLPVGLLLYPAINCIITNGSVGHLQFYHPQENKRIQNLDISLNNFILRESHESVVNSSVEKAAISGNGRWLATYEYCKLADRLQDISLKFWYCRKQEKGWELNTFIQMPHTEKINSMCFSPTSTSSKELYCITCSEDKRVKIWRLISSKSNNQPNTWECFAVREFSEIPPWASAFSADGSVLALCFDSYLTLWNVDDSFSRMGIFNQFYLTEKILDVTFSIKEKEGSLIITRTENYLCSWDLLTCELLWKVDLPTSCMAIDPASGILAVFSSQKKKVYFFSAVLENPIATCDSSDEFLSALFIPSENRVASANLFPWKSRSSLYYANAKQEVHLIQYKETKGEEILDDDGTTIISLSTKQIHASTPMASHLEHSRKIIGAEQIHDEVIFRGHQNFDLFDDFFDKIKVHQLDSFSSICKSYALAGLPAPMERIHQQKEQHTTNKQNTPSYSLHRTETSTMEVKEQTKGLTITDVSKINFDKLVKRINK